jgi:hypothetical protein
MPVKELKLSRLRVVFCLKIFISLLTLLQRVCHLSASLVLNCLGLYTKRKSVEHVQLLCWYSHDELRVSLVLKQLLRFRRFQVLSQVTLGVGNKNGDSQRNLLMSTVYGYSAFPKGPHQLVSRIPINLGRKAVQRIAATEFRVRLFSSLRLVVAPPAHEPGQDTSANSFPRLDHLAPGQPPLLAARSPDATGLASSLSGCFSLTVRRCRF